MSPLRTGLCAAVCVAFAACSPRPGSESEPAPVTPAKAAVASAAWPFLDAADATPSGTKGSGEAPLSVAELSAYLSLPFSVVTVLLTEMLATGLVNARAPIVRQRIPDRSLLEAVMHGLQRL